MYCTIHMKVCLHFCLLCQVRASAAMEREQVMTEVKRQAELEKEIAVQETKKKKWVSTYIHVHSYSVQ